MEENTVKMINQPLLPFTFEIAESRTYKETAEHIRKMTVRGAPAIGAAGAYAMAQAVLSSGTSDIEKAEAELKSTRPTAHDLFAGIEYVKKAIVSDSTASIQDRARNAAEQFAQESIESCRRIGELGNSLIQDGIKVLTHCNAGWLACVDWGTALAPLYAAHRSSKEIFVYVDETRPRGQGARLTAWELHNEGIAHAVIADNAAGYFMANGSIDLVIVGADRIALNGDTANKIGTLEKAVLAQRFNLPFYIAAPLTTIDPQCVSGRDIPIEERSSDEVMFRTGLAHNGRIEKIRVTNPGSDILNPAFDVTPAELITGIITPRGIIKPEEVEELTRYQMPDGS